MRMARLGVVEVGSGAVRLLVAMPAPGFLLDVIDTEEQQHHVRMDNLGDPESLHELRLLVQYFYNKLKLLQCSKQRIVGTELVRVLLRSDPHALPSFVEPISSSEEARCSFLAASMALKTRDKDRRYIVLDQGRGSMEFITGTFESNALRFGCDSFPFGTSKLTEIFLDNSFDAKAVERYVQDERFSATYLSPQKKRSLILQGGVATALVWIKVRDDEDEIYKPAKVMGKIIRRQEIEQILNYTFGLAKQDEARAIGFIEKRQGAEEKYRRVIPGAIALNAIMKQMCFEEAVVSAYGTRHGVALLMAMSP